MAAGKPSELRRRLDRARSSVRPFVVVEDSMRPSLEPGDGLIGVRRRRIRVGEVRIFEHPTRPGFWLVKRVGSVDGDRFDATSDNTTASAVDSRHFGSVPVAGSYRSMIRIRRAVIDGGRRSSLHRRVPRVVRSRGRRVRS
ncbi:MAG: S26 family signal peptidase [Ilumatobacteraceae bacterium]